MPPSGHHRQRFAHNPLHLPVRRQNTLQASSTSDVSQQAQISPSNAGVETQVSRNTAVAGATVAIVVVVSILLCSVAFFLVRYRRKRRKAMLQTLPDEWSWTDVGDSISPREQRGRFKEQKAEGHADIKPTFISLVGEGLVPGVSEDSNDQTDSPETRIPKSPEMDKNHVSRLGSPNFHLPSLTFTLPSPVTPAPTRDSRVFDMDPDSRLDSLFDECMNALMGEESMEDPVPRLDCGRRRRESGDSATLNELSWWSNDSGQSSTGPATPSERTPVKDSEGASHDHSDAGESDKSGWELLTKIRKFLPSTPPSLRSSITFEPDSSSVAVRRSFTSPAFFTMVTPPNNSAVCLKPLVQDKRESVASNYILAFLDGQGKLGLDLMDESLPPPAIIVSPPTASTINLCRQSTISLDQFADAVDPWSIAYGVQPNLNVSSIPVAFNVELSKRAGDPFVTRPSRPPKSRRRTYVQRQVEAY